MSIAKKIQKWVDNQIITQEQKDSILAFEKTNNNKNFWKIAYIIAGLFIGLGICLIISANWKYFSSLIKLLGDFTLFGAFICGAIRSYEKRKDGLKELFIILLFLMIGATIGLISQIFNLEGGWSSFALFWALLGIPFVLFSCSRCLNYCWWFLFFSSFFTSNLFEEIMQYINENAEGFILTILLLYLLSYIGDEIDKKIQQYTLLPNTFSCLLMFIIYSLIFIFCCFKPDLALFSIKNIGLPVVYICSIMFFVARMFIASKNQNVVSFKRNAIAIEIYIFILFVSCFDNLLMSGFGFIIGGLLILLAIYIFRQTSKYIKNMEIFNE